MKSSLSEELLGNQTSPTTCNNFLSARKKYQTQQPPTPTQPIGFCSITKSILLLSFQPSRQHRAISWFLLILLSRHEDFEHQEHQITQNLYFQKLPVTSIKEHWAVNLFLMAVGPRLQTELANPFYAGVTLCPPTGLTIKQNVCSCWTGRKGVITHSA